MTCFSVTATVRTPLAMSLSKAAGNDLDTARAIPGSAIRGALAYQFLGSDAKRAASAPFRELFLDGGLRFGDLRLNGHDVWPFSARSCKADPERHPVGDVLFTTAAGRMARPDCPFEQCGAKLEVPRGWRFETAHGFEFPKVRTRRIAHAEIDIETNASRGGSFHSSRVICKDQRFDGRVWISTPTAGRGLKDLVGGGRELYLGRGRSRGQGRVGFRLLGEPQVLSSNLTQRVEEFNREAAVRFPELRRRVLFSCLLQSAGIVYDRWLMSRLCLCAEDFDAELKGYTPIAWSSRAVTLSGWHSAAGLPKPDMTGIASGSCWLFGKEVEATGRAAEISRIGPLLGAAESRGIGERLAEGFGEAKFCDPFHWKHAIQGDAA